MNTQEKLASVKNIVENLKDKQSNLGEFGMTAAYISLLNDYSSAIDSIENGFGNIYRPADENAEEVLKDLRDNFGCAQYSDKVYDLKCISEFEQEVFFAIEYLERILTEECA